jgi:uncharacterized protein (TIGR02284 family)
MNNETAILVLNSLIITHHERMERYRFAAKKIPNYTLKKAFDKFQQTSLKFKTELIKEVLEIGGKPLDYNKSRSSFYRFWYLIRTIFTYRSYNALISSCAKHDLTFMKKYYDTITYHSDSFTDDQKIMLSEQYFLINTEQHQINSFKKMQLKISF